MSTYLDPSLVVSLYAIDAGSVRAAAAMALCSEAPLITTLGHLEVISAFQLQVFRNEVSPERTAFSIRNFEDDIGAGVYRLRSLPTELFARAQQISRKHTAGTGIRTADLLHVAAALELGADAFFSFDLQQRKLAEAVGLTLNPL